MRKGYTTVPNVILDELLPLLTVAELKTLLVIIRQTFGWSDKKGSRKKRDWISTSQFVSKTGLSRQTVSKTIGILHRNKLIVITDREGVRLDFPSQRKGKTRLYYCLGDRTDVSLFTMRCKVNHASLVGFSTYDKRKKTKETDTVRELSISEILRRMFR